MNQNSNPVFRNMVKNQTTNTYVDVENVATWKGIISKVALLVGIALAAGFSVFFLPFELLIAFVIIGPIASFFLVFSAMRNPAKAKSRSILYSIFQGITYGTITGLIEIEFPGIGFMALGITFVIVLVMALLHSTNSVRATPKLVRFVMASLIMVIISSLVLLVISVALPNLHASFMNNYPLMVIISGFLIILGAIMLIIDFENAKAVVSSGSPKMYEWQVSLGIMVTVVWLYLQLLRFLSIILRNRSR